MSKEDVPIPDRPPAKRRQLEQTLDLWLAVWASAPNNLTPSEHRRVTEERARRKALKPHMPVGVIIGPEGMSRRQRRGVIEAIPMSATVLNLLTSTPRGLAGDVPVVWYEQPRDLVIASKQVIVAARSASADTPLQYWIRYARHRRLPVRVILPDGSEA